MIDSAVVHLDQGRGRRSSPTLATFLSFLWPGLGQWYAGAGRRAALYALPVLAVAVAVAIQASDGAANLVLSLLSPSTALTVVGLVAVLFAWRLLSMADALTSTGVRGSWRRPVPVAVFLVLALLITGTHAWAGSLALSFYRAGSQIFVDDPGPDATGGPSQAPASGGAATPAPSATPMPADARINILLVGVDSSEARTHALTDTLIVVSVDPLAGAVAMVSFPRDIARFELPDGRIFRGKINSLMSWAESRPDEFPDGPLPTVSQALGHLLGVPIDFYASIDLAGFARMVDRVGGVTIDNQRAIDDPGYGGWSDGRVGFQLSVGTHTLDGETALAFVRTRKGAGDNDFNRARRQQQLLVALQRELIDPSMLPELPGLLEDLQETVVSNFPPDRLGEMLSIAQAVDDQGIERVVLGPPYAVRPTDGLDGGTYTLRLDMARLAALSIELFGADSRYAALD